MIMANFEKNEKKTEKTEKTENETPEWPNRFIKDHFKSRQRQKDQDPSHQLKLKLLERDGETAIERKDKDQHVFSFSADQYYHDIKHNESLKQTRLEKRKEKWKNVFNFDRTVPSKKTVNPEQYKKYTK